MCSYSFPFVIHVHSYKEVCKRDLKALEINTSPWEDLAKDRSSWKQVLISGLKAGEARLRKTADIKRAHRKKHMKNCLKIYV